MTDSLLANAERDPAERPDPNVRPALPDILPPERPWHGGAVAELRRLRDEVAWLRARVRELEFQVGG